LKEKSTEQCLEEISQTDEGSKKGMDCENRARFENFKKIYMNKKQDGSKKL